jgi:hypothetical protein
VRQDGVDAEAQLCVGESSDTGQSGTFQHVASFVLEKIRINTMIRSSFSLRENQRKHRTCGMVKDEQRNMH